MGSPAPPTFKSPTGAPTQKVAAGGIGGAVSVIVIAILQHYAHIAIDPTLASAITTVVSFALGYVVPPAARDLPVQASG